MAYMKGSPPRPQLGSFVNPTSHRRGLPDFMPRRMISRPAPFPIEGMQNQRLQGFFSSAIAGVKRTLLTPIKATVALVTHGPKAFVDVHKAEIEGIKTDFTGMGTVVAPVLSLFGPWGKAAAVAVGALTVRFKQEAAAKAAALAASARSNDPTTLINEYSRVAGSVPGRVFGVELMLQVLRAGFASGALKSYAGAAVDPSSADLIFYSGNQAGCSNWAQLAQSAASANVFDALQIFQIWGKAPFGEGGTCGSNAPWNSQLGAQIAIDSFDALIAKLNPNAPITYGAVPADYEQPGAVVQSAAPQVPGSGATGPMSTSTRVTPVLMSESDVARITSENNAKLAQMELTRLQQGLDAAKAQLVQAQTTGNSDAAARAAEQMKALQAAQSQTAQNYSSSFRGSSMSAGDVAETLSKAGIDTTGAVGAGIAAGASPMIFGLPRAAVIGGGLLAGLGLYFYMRKRRR